MAVELRVLMSIRPITTDSKSIASEIIMLHQAHKGSFLAVEGDDYRIEYDYSNNKLKRIDMVIINGTQEESVFETKQYYSFDPIF